MHPKASKFLCSADSKSLKPVRSGQQQNIRLRVTPQSRHHKVALSNRGLYWRRGLFDGQRIFFFYSIFGAWLIRKNAS